MMYRAGMPVNTFNFNQDMRQKVKNSLRTLMNKLMQSSFQTLIKVINEKSWSVISIAFLT